MKAIVVKEPTIYEPRTEKSQKMIPQGIDSTNLCYGVSVLGSIFTALVVGPPRPGGELCLDFNPSTNRPVLHKLVVKLGFELRTYEIVGEFSDRYERIPSGSFIRMRYPVNITISRITDNVAASSMDVSFVQRLTVGDHVEKVVLEMVGVLKLPRKSTISSQGFCTPELSSRGYTSTPLEFGTFFDLVFPTAGTKTGSSWTVTHPRCPYGDRVVEYTLIGHDNNRAIVNAKLPNSEYVLMRKPYTFVISSHSGIIEHAAGSLQFRSELGWIQMEFDEQRIDPNPETSKQLPMK